MTVLNFMEYSIEVNYQKFTIYDVDKEEEVFNGVINECPTSYLNAEVYLFDVIDEDSPNLTLNVSLED